MWQLAIVNEIVLIEFRTGNHTVERYQNISFIQKTLPPLFRYSRVLYS